ncbi:MAG: hypothetical protein ACFE8L_05160 [Candidatus Hodarchaeota archaeon]
MPKKDIVKEVTPKIIQKLVDQVNQLEENIGLITNELKENVEFIKENIRKIENEIAIYKERTEETIRTQEDIIMSMVYKFNDQFLQEKNKIIADLESVKTQFDVLKISFTVNENQLLEKLRTMIREELKNVITGKEDEILMKLWIDELKRIITNFENLKKVHPKEFNLQIEEISNTIDIFKQKLQGS